jgi:hypothetical protein
VKIFIGSPELEADVIAAQLGTHQRVTGTCKGKNSTDILVILAQGNADRPSLHTNKHPIAGDLRGDDPQEALRILV